VEASHRIIAPDQNNEDRLGLHLSRSRL